MKTPSSNVLLMLFAPLLGKLFCCGSLVAADDQISDVDYEGASGPGLGRQIVLHAGDHEYRSEETIPALARILARH